MILVDTCIWVDHLRVGDIGLDDLLQRGRVLAHPFVIGELACGNLRNRGEILELLGHLPAAPQADQDEMLYLIERHQLMGRGLGYVDIHLLAAALLLPGTRLWTRDRQLAELAEELDVEWRFRPVLHDG